MTLNSNGGSIFNNQVQNFQAIVICIESGGLCTGMPADISDAVDRAEAYLAYLRYLVA